jgi:hypothetical protein
VGCVPNGPAKHIWLLGRFLIETFLRSACLGWLYQTLCSYVGYLGVSTVHTFKGSNIALSVLSLTTSSCDAPFKILLGILGYWTSLI